MYGFTLYLLYIKTNMSFILPLKSYPHAGFGIFLLCKCLEFFTILYFRIIIAELAAIFTEFLLNTTSSALKLLLKLSNSYSGKCKCKRMRKGEVCIYMCVCLSIYIYMYQTEMTQVGLESGTPGRL